MELSVFDSLLEENKKINQVLEQCLNDYGLENICVTTSLDRCKNYLDICVERSGNSLYGNNFEASIPIYCHDRNVGQLRCYESDGIAQFFYQHSELVKEKIGFLVNRVITDSIAEKILGHGQCLLGISDTLIRIDQMLFRAAHSRCPVIILTPPGGESLAAASAVHYYSDFRDKPFVEFNCAVVDDSAFEDKLLNCIKKVGSGTLYLCELDQLSAHQQEVLLDLFTISSHSLAHRGGHLRNTRLIASVGTDIEHKIRKKSFPKRLYEEFDFVSIQLPTLQQRKQDIPYLVNIIAERFRVNSKQFFNGLALNKLSAYEWPGNYKQLERTVAQLMVLSSHTEISAQDIEPYVSDGSIFEAQYEQEGDDHNIVLTKMLEQDFTWFEGFHYSLKKAVEYICNNYFRDISLKELADYSCVSPSHLSYLFRTNISKSFKQVLTEIRLEKAKEMLTLQPAMRITEVSLESGFGDLSHFEKTFKKYTGLTPRDFKGQAKENYRSNHYFNCV